MASGRAAANDHQTAIPKTDERVSRNRKRDEQCHEGGHEPPDRAEVFAGWPTAEGAAGQAHLANARRSAGGDLAASARRCWRRRRIWRPRRCSSICGSVQPWAVQEKHLRTFQRRVKLWRLAHGPDKEVFFPQDWEAGRAMQLDWTNANELAVTIAGRPYDHLLCHCVLPHSNWEWATRCLSESLLSFRQGLQEALHRLGKVPRELRMDNSSAATHRVGGGGTGREFNEQFVSLCEHYGLVPRTIGIDCPNENGDVESSNGHLKRRMRQHLLLRGSRDFDSEADYERFLQQVLERGNRGRQENLARGVGGR